MTRESQERVTWSALGAVGGIVLGAVGATGASLWQAFSLVDTVEARVSSRLDDRLAAINVKVEYHGRRMDAQDHRLQRIEEKIDALLKR